MSDFIVPVEAGELERLVVLSPHFDDACMGAGRLLLANPGAGPLRADHDLDARLAIGLKEADWRLAAPPPGWEALQSVET